MTRGARWGRGRTGGSKRSEWVDEEETLGDERVWECVDSVKRLAVRDDTRTGDMDETPERAVAEAENVVAEGVSGGDDVDATGSPVHSMRTRLLLKSAKMTSPWPLIVKKFGPLKRA